MEDLNNKCLFRNYPVFSSIKWRCLLLCVLSTAFSCIWVASFLLSATYGSILKDKTYWVMNFIIGLPIVCSICPCGLLIIYGCRRMVALLSSFSFVSPFLSKSICFFFFFAFSVFYIIFQYCNKCYLVLKRSTGIHFVVLRYNLRFYRSSKCLVYFDQTTLTEPTVSFFFNKTDVILFCKNIQNHLY